MSTKTPHRSGVISLVALAFVYASMGLFVRFLGTSFSINQQVYLRSFVAFVMALFVFSKSIRYSNLLKISSKEWVLLFFRSLCFYALGVTLFSRAIIATKYGNVSFIGSLPLTALFGILLMKEKLSWKAFFYICVTLFGATIMSAPDFAHVFNWGKGELFALLSTVFFSIAYVTRRWHGDILNNAEITTLILGIGSLQVFALSLASGEALPTQGWTIVLVLAVLGAGLTNIINGFLTNYGFQHVNAVLASNILMLESPFALIIGLIFFREVPVMREMIGAALIAYGAWKINQSES